MTSATGQDPDTVLRQDGARTARAPVMLDVARLAGVSHQTVSRVLNDHPSVAPATRDRVSEAIRALGYRRNEAARALKSRQTMNIGVLAHNTTLYGPASTLNGVERAAHQAGYATTLATVESTTRRALAEALDRLLARSVDGVVIAVPLHEADDLAYRVPEELPLVVVHGGPEKHVPFVHVDHRQGARDVVNHLLDLGHETVWHVTGPGGWAETAQRREGWLDALVARGAQVPATVEGDWSPRSGYLAGLALADTDNLGAIFVANDQMSLGLLRALRERGIQVPEQVSVVGFDDVPESEFFSPPLTTVRQDFAEVGSRSISLVLEQVAGRDRDAVAGHVVPAQLVTRNSSAAPAGRKTTTGRRHG